MTRILLTLALLLWATAAQAQMALVNADCDVGNHWSGSSTYNHTIGWTPTVGNLLVVVANVADGGSGTVDVSSIANGSASFTEEREHRNTGAGHRLAIWGGIAAGTPTTTVAVTLTTTASNVSNVSCVAEFSGAGSIGAQPANSATNTAVTSHPAGSVTPGTTYNVIVGSSQGSNRTWTQASGFTTLLVNTRTVVGYVIQASNTSQNFTPTSDTSGDSSAIAVSFDGAAAGGGGCTGGLTLLGAGKCDY